jgi:prefoldin beta subunit
MIEETLQHYSASRQTFHSQLLELDSSLNELSDKSTAYKIIGAIMVEKTSDELRKELMDKKKTVEIRISNIEKQEDKVKQKFESLQKEIMEDIKDSE